MQRSESTSFGSSGKAQAGLGPLLGTVGLTLPWALGPLAAHAVAQSPTAAPPAQAPLGSAGADAPQRVGDLDPVTVSGIRSLLHDKLAESEQKAPQSITVVTPQLLAAQGSTSLEDALRNVPGITLNAGEGAARGDTVNLRGFSAFNDFFLDGIRDAAVYTRDDFDVESVEVLKGPSAVLFGQIGRAHV